MRFHVEFAYSVDVREKLFHFLDSGALAANPSLKVVGAWLAVETGLGYAQIDTDDAKSLYDICSRWSEYGTLKVVPVVSVKELPR